MAHVHSLVAQAELHFSRQFQQAEEVGDGGALLTNTLAQSLLGEVVLVDEFAESERNFDGV